MIRWLALGLSVLAAIAAAGPAVGQLPATLTPPVSARLILKNPPPNVTYGTNNPIVIVVEVRNPTAAAVITTEGFSRTEFWRRLVFTDPDGRAIANFGQTPDEGQRTFFCLSRSGVLQRPTAIPVLPVEILTPSPTDPPAGFFVSYTIDDAQKYYDLTKPGRYRVNARIPLQTFQANSDALIADCDQFADTTVAQVSGVSGRQQFAVISNSLEFVIGSPLRFSGFRKPLVGDELCRNAVQSPCTTVKLNRTMWVEFQLIGPDNAPITTAHPRITLSKIGGATFTLRNDLFEYHAGQKEYRYLLETRGLSTGVWRIDVVVDIDGSVHSAHFALR